MVPEDSQLGDLFSLFYCLPRVSELSHINLEANDLQYNLLNVFYVFIKNLMTGPRSLGFIPQKPDFSSQINESAGETHSSSLPFITQRLLWN